MNLHLLYDTIYRSSDSQTSAPVLCLADFFLQRFEFIPVLSKPGDVVLLILCNHRLDFGFILAAFCITGSNLSFLRSQILFQLDGFFPVILIGKGRNRLLFQKILHTGFFVCRDFQLLAQFFLYRRRGTDTFLYGLTFRF